MMKDPHLPNKLFGATLTAAWVVMIAAVGGPALYKPDEPPAERAFPIAVVEATAPAEEPATTTDQPETDVASLLASADTGAGANIAKKCTACHSFDKGGANKVGPPLWDIVQRPIAHADGYRYSSALAEMDGAWNYEALGAFLAAPKDFAPGTKMAFAGIRKDSDLANLIAYLRTLSDNPAPLP